MAKFNRGRPPVLKKVLTNAIGITSIVLSCAIWSDMPIITATKSTNLAIEGQGLLVVGDVGIVHCTMGVLAPVYNHLQQAVSVAPNVWNGVYVVISRIVKCCGRKEASSKDECPKHDARV